MSDGPEHDGDPEGGLRHDAEAAAAREVRPDPPGTTEQTSSLLHELRVHEIELTMQNEELRRTQDELDVSHENYRELFDYAPVGYVTLDDEGVVCSANLTAARLLFTHRGALIGTLFSRFIVTSDQDIFYHTQRHLRAGEEPPASELRMLRHCEPGGEERTFWAHLEVRPQPREEGSAACWLTFSDVSARRAAEEEVVRLNADLAQTVEDRTRDLTLANTELEEFVYSITHDLRSPLRALAGFSKILRDDYAGDIDAAGLGYLQRIQDAAMHLGDVMDALLALSRVNRAALQVCEVDVSTRAREVVAQLAEADPDRVVEAHIQDGLVSLCDPSLCDVLLHNLIGNAWKFTAGRSPAHISLTASDADGRRVFCVADNGAGFDERYTDRLFQPFERLHTVDEFPGTGIGLATVKRIVNRFNGECWAEGEIGVGAKVWFSLPVPPTIP